MPAEPELGVEALLERLQPQLGEPPALDPEAVPKLDAGARLAAPERERVVEERAGTGGLADRELAPRGCDEPFEAARVDLVVVGLEPVPVAGSRVTAASPRSFLSSEA